MPIECVVTVCRSQVKKTSKFDSKTSVIRTDRGIIEIWVQNSEEISKIEDSL